MLIMCPWVFSFQVLPRSSSELLTAARRPAVRRAIVARGSRAGGVLDSASG